MNNHRDMITAAGRLTARGALSSWQWIGVFWAMVLMGGFAVTAAGQGTAPAVGEEERGSGFDYVVERGDTFWDLSQRFGGSPYQWPQMWTHNNQIPNPHRIFPGDRIRFAPRSFGLPPESLPGPSSSRGMEFRNPPAPPASYYYPGIETVGFIRREQVAPAAIISSLPEDHTIAGQWETAWGRPAEGGIVMPGQQFVVYRVLEPVTEASGKKFVGYPHYLLGVVEIAAVSGGSFRAEIVHSYREMRVGDKLMPRPVRRPDADILLAEAPAGIAGRILRPEEDVVLLSDQSVVFINRGRSDGVAVGQRYTICDPGSAGGSACLGSGEPAAIGSLLVLRVEDETATALVTASAREIPFGASVISAASDQ
jgi:hypothetical protein